MTVPYVVTSTVDVMLPRSIEGSAMMLTGC